MHKRDMSSASSLSEADSEKTTPVDQIERAATQCDDSLGLPPPPDLSPEQERALWRKIDMRLMPMLSIMYLMSFLDRGQSL